MPATKTAATRCPPGTIRNPKTKRCVKKDGKTGKELLSKKEEKKKTAPSKKTASKKAASKKTAKTPSPQKPLKVGKMQKGCLEVAKTLVDYVGLVKGARLSAILKDQEMAVMQDSKGMFKVTHFDNATIVSKTNSLDKKGVLERLAGFSCETLNLLVDKLNKNKTVLAVW